MDKKNANRKEQKVLKTLDNINKWFSKIILYLAYLCIPVFLIMTVYYSICKYNGIDVENRLLFSAAGLAVFSASCACMKLLEYLMDKLQQRDADFDPFTMRLPDLGTVTLETALHMMSFKTGVIVWDTLFITFLAILLSMMLFVGGNVPLILFICLLLAAFLAAGHLFISWRWKKRSFAPKMLRNTEKYISVKNPREYLQSVEESLLHKLLYYGKEMILTDRFIIGITETDVQFHPVAIPRAEIVEITFFSKRPVMNRYRKYDTGILECRMKSGKAVELLIGQGTRMIRVLKVLNHYRIWWKKKDTLYV